MSVLACTSALNGFGGLFEQVAEATSQGLLQLRALDHHVEKPMLQEEFAALKTLRQILADGLLDDPWSGESDQCPWFGDVEVSQHRKRSRDTTRGRIGKHREEW